MTRMTGGEALVQSLVRHGVEVVFGVPGYQLYHATDALHGEPNIRYITTRHEQAAAYMAYGYSRTGGGTGTAMVVPGPGLLNATAAIGTAYSASTSMLVVSGQIPREFQGFNRGELHEVDDQLDCVRPITKWAARIDDPRRIPDAVQEAFRHLSTGRPRPVEIEMPLDTLEEAADIDLPVPVQHPRQAPARDSVAEAARLLAAARRPVIWAGGGVFSSRASGQLERLAEYLQAPVVASYEGRGSISDRSYLSLGAPNLRRDRLDDFLDECDVVLAVGTRLARTSFQRQTLVQIDVDPDEIGRNYQDNTVGVLGDAALTLDVLRAALEATGPARPVRREEFEAIKAERSDPANQIEPQGSFVQAIRAAMPDDGILVPDETQIGYYSRSFFPVYTPGTFVTSSYFGNLGYGFPTALGAKVAWPDRVVVSISGDGGFMFNVQELATAAMHRINVVAIVFNDNAFGNVMRSQIHQFDGRVVGSELENPDFVKLGQAFGVRSVRVHEPDELTAAITDATAIEAPSLIEVPVEMMPDPL
jgi:acetolactate synthase-1/2/3 large subunit